MFSFRKTGAGPTASHRQLVSRGALLLDVRTPAEFATSHVEAPYEAPAGTPSAPADIGAKKTVVVYCRSGARSAAAAGILRTAGHDVHDIGGMGNW